jgi:4-amino-4-deoxy-L-arabinose transferase-like glycosyltransferase
VHADDSADVVHRSRLEVAIVAAITLVGLLLRLRSVGNSLFGDELGTYSIVNGHGVGSIVSTLNGHSVDLTPPLYFILAWVGERLGSSPEALRSPAVLAGVATIPLTYLLGLRTVGRRAAIIAALLVALSPFLIFYGTEARAYSVVMFLVLASTLALLKAIQIHHARYWIAYACLSCAAIYTHYTAVFPLAAQAIWALVVHRAQFRQLMAANLAAAVGFAPWLPALSKNSGSFGTKVFGIVDPFGVHAIVHDVSHWAIGHPYLPLSAAPGPVASALVLGGLLLAAALGAGQALATRSAHSTGAERVSAHASGLVLAVVLALAAPVGLALYSAVADSAWDMRNLISSWPAFALSLGALLMIQGRRLGILAAALVIVGFVIGAARQLPSFNERPDYAAAAHLVLSRGALGDPVAIVQAPTPGPYSAMDAAFAFAGDPGRPLLRVGAPSLEAVLKAPPYAFLPASSPAALATATERVGAPEVFVIVPGTAPAAELLRPAALDVRQALGPNFGTGISGALLGTVFTPVSAYLRAIAARYVPVQTIHLPGFLRLSVYVFRRR